MNPKENKKQFEGDRNYAIWLLNGVITIKTIDDFISEKEVIDYVNNWLSKDRYKNVIDKVEKDIRQINYKG